MAEVTSKVIQELAPNIPGTPVRLVYVKGTTAATGDTLTVSDLTTVLGALYSNRMELHQLPFD